MDINVSTKMGFNNQNFLKQSTKNDMPKPVVASEICETTDTKTVFENNNYCIYNDLQMLSIAAQADLNNKLKETLKYLNMRIKDKKKEHVFGELWDEFFTNYEENIEEGYPEELFDYEPDNSNKNIFAA